MIEVIPIGGFSEIGRNSTIVKWGEEAVILDFGLHMENYIDLTRDNYDVTPQEMITAEAVPNLQAVEEYLPYVQGLCVSHAHLDHVGAIPYFINEINAPIHATGFTINVLKTLLRDKRIKSKVKLVEHNENHTFNVSKNIKVQFIKITHSTPQTVAVVVHTPDGCIVYANDFKLDNAPLLGARTNYQALEDLDNVRALIMDSLYSLKPGKTPSEAVAREMLRDVLLGTTTDNSNIIATTFSSHVARLKTLCDLASSLGRKPVLVGRSLAKYVGAAKNADIIDLESRAQDMVKYGGKVESYFRNLNNTKDKMFIVTGHQGEPNAILSRLVTEDIFPFEEEDVVIFSCDIIPGEENIENRAALEQKLRDRNIRIYKDIHVSGHARKEDHRELIKMLEPEHFIPTHGNPEMLTSSESLAVEMGYEPDKIHILKNAERLEL